MEATEIKYDRHVESSLIGEYLNDCRFVKIPDNATNGDMIKAMFPEVKELRRENGCVGITWKIIEDDYIHWFREDWWDAPYKSENEE